ncbi:hypothetical protein IWQ56_004294 [Coemansia nantahalensis]|uniref:Uncharacterized protein n=1 Tax=Coemansia nantahalensis TaxID=2789366 RepID=A0ACC1JTT8_9FUNG|nr:hypothetical protein IWQ56_004294 [Coemansia nantahalensis]KAJ2767287.1 hypothetical protein IWQ57_004010 [Coemansia nantahalensis]
MRVQAAALALAVCLGAANGLTPKEDQAVGDILEIFKRGTSVYPLVDLMHNLAVSMGFQYSAQRINRFGPEPKDAYATVYDMLISVDTNGKHTVDQHVKLRQLIDIIGTKILNLNSKEISFRTLIIQEEEDDSASDSSTARASASAVTRRAARSHA